MSDPTNNAYEVRSLARLIGIVNDGDSLAADEDYHKLMARLSEHVERHGSATRGSITLKLDISADPKGVDVVLTHAFAIPKSPTAKTRFFVTDRGDDLTAKNPNQKTMFEDVNLGRKGFKGLA